MFAGVEEDAGSGEKNEGGRAEMRDPPGEEDAGSGTVGGKAGVNADVIDGHDDHDGPADDINGHDARGGRGNCYHRGSLNSGAHGSLRKRGVLLCVSPGAMTFDVFVTR